MEVILFIFAFGPLEEDTHTGKILQMPMENKDQWRRNLLSSFPNGGMVKVSKKGKAKFKLHLPQGYMSEQGFVPPHFHYCLCYRGRRSPVQTVYIERSVPCATNKPMLVHSNPSDLEVGLREIFRHKFHTFRDLEVARPRQARFTT